MAEIDRLAIDTSRGDCTRLEEQRGLQAPHTSRPGGRRGGVGGAGGERAGALRS